MTLDDKQASVKTRPAYGFAPMILRDLRRNSMVVALVIVVALFSFLTDGTVVRDANISNLIAQNGYVLILAVGMVMVIIAGHIDLSVGSVAGFVGAAAGVMIAYWSIPWPIVIVLALAVGGLIGAWQGFWIAYVGVPSFIVTLAGMITFRGLTLVVLGRNNIGSFPEGYRALGNGFLTDLAGEYETDPVTVGVFVLAAAVIALAAVRSRKRRLRLNGADEPFAWFLTKLVIQLGALLFVGFALARYKGIPVILIIVVLIVIIYTVLTRRTAFGRHVYAIGGNRRAAELSGVKTKRADLLIFVNMGVLAALAGLVFTARLNLSNPSSGTGFELEAIAAAFVGGAAIQGGAGTVGGAVIGGVVIGLLNNGMSILGLGTEWQQTVKGLVLLAAVGFDFWNKRRLARSRA
ncbi:multiple monosaccharide ABC transporter permease [Amnibacterium flavum]|uniref:Xylose transport system permease protein XylH n=1 Tax=Amnibacterium flavum TaxID=2173173 RepID=A0A2V1HNS8_9MICO|nr:multiple monosaccharide ABC transporter permease [Amnibacterium flavum]PVZ93242.1 sugar ABC transporter permease [Amnibacterium flavum]